MRILKVPYNAGGLSKKDGVEWAPDAIAAQFKDMFLREDGLLPVTEIQEIKVDNTNIEESRNILKNAAKTTPFLALGGDHSMTRSLFEGFSQGDAGLIVFDAHPDMMDGENSHEDWLRSLIEEKILDPTRLILIGLRNIHGQEVDFIRRHKINTFSMKEISQKGLAEVCDGVMSVARQWNKLYLSIDIDVLDPAFAPGTGYAEPGGMTTRELVYFVQRLKLLKNLEAADIVEVNPKKDPGQITVKTAAKIALELT